MRKELIFKTKSLAGSSDLTLLAPIKPGLVPSLESVTYKTRIKRLLKTLNAGRASSHEYALLRPISDAVERVGKIHSVRVAVLEPEDKVLLAVTFDGAWDSYIRVLWQKVGALLDVIFCNTVDYVSARDHCFEDWADWARRVQIETGFFYGLPGVTVDDVRYLRSEEALRREKPATSATDLAATQKVVHSVERTAWNAATDSAQTEVEAFMQGLQALALLYRLTDLYLPTGEDGKFLHRAARELLLEFIHLWEDRKSFPEALKPLARLRFDRQLDWISTPDPARAVPPLPTTLPSCSPAGDVQGGILRPYKDITHGSLLLFAVDTRAAAAAFLGTLIAQVTKDEDPELQSGQVAVNVGVTCEGLRAVGLTEAQLARFPQEFREGMEARASVLGDVRTNHPRRWRLPERNWPQPAGAEPQRIEWSAVHLVVQLRTASPSDVDDPTDPAHPLHRKVTELARHEGVRLLSVQALRRYARSGWQGGLSWEHFGFADGEGQPVIDPALAGTTYRNQIHLGEILLGYDNEADFAPDPDRSADPVAAHERLGWLRNGSFLVVRKLAQDVKALDDAVAAASNPTLSKEQILAKMLGRTKDGGPLASPGSGNDFDYRADASGSKCPFQAHIRRANPRERTPGFHEPLGRRTPRIVRRGMSYGPRYDLNKPADDPVNLRERGLVFMAYNASLSEQFEPIQRWISGGNSTGVFSGQSDPFLGVAENGQKRFFRFEHDADVVHMSLDDTSILLDDRKPFVRLEWGAYLFTPSITALGKLKDAAANKAADAAVWSVDEGQRQIDALQLLERRDGPQAATVAWKAVLEDPLAQENYVGASVWAAVREHHQGVLRTPYGVLVADHELVMQVLHDAEGCYSVSGYHERMLRSVGEIYLGLDRLAPDGPYEQQARDTNAAILDIKEQDAFELARKHTAAVLQGHIDLAVFLAGTRQKRWDLNLDLRELSDAVLAILCQDWFGLPESGGPIEPGSARWDWDPAKDKPLYPGNFTAPSRYIFQPQPGVQAEQFGSVYGTTLTDAMRRFVTDCDRKVPNGPDGKPARIAAGIFKAYANPAFEDLPEPALHDLVARTMVGALMGFLPTVDGNLRLSLNEWLRDGSFWSLRAGWVEHKAEHAADIAEALRRSLVPAMQLRPSPELVWRTAARDHTLGKGRVAIEAGARVVVAIVSATQQALQDGRADLFPLFGGDRRQAAHPTHACPAYAAGMGVLLGILYALLDVKESMRPSPAPLAFTFDGPNPNFRSNEP